MTKRPSPETVRGPAVTLPRLGDRDRGNVTVEHVVIYPVLLLLIFAVIQSGVWWHARNMALAAAESGVREGRVAGSATVGVDVARSYLEQVANDTFDDVTVTSTGSTAEEVQVTVTGTVPSMFAGLLDLQVSQSARGPIEQVR